MITGIDDSQDPVCTSIKANSVSYNKRRSWRGHYCCIPGCTNSASNKKKQNKLGSVSYHAFPDVKSAKGKQWIQRICHDPGTNSVVNARTKICSEHFSPNDLSAKNLLQKVKGDDC